MAPAKRRATYADLLAVPDHKVAEIVDGELVVSPRPAIPHAKASSALGVVVGGPFGFGTGGPGGWVILDEPELHVGEDVLVPDLASWRREHLPVAPQAAYISLAPDWICEVLSPTTEKLLRADKLPIYARERVAHAWLVNPLARTLEVFALDGARWSLLGTFAGDKRARIVPFDAIEIELRLLWPETQS
jgi:Uma2 family endonuclease